MKCVEAKRPAGGGQVARNFGVAMAGLLVLDLVASVIGPAAAPVQVALASVMFASVMTAIVVGVRRYHPRDVFVWRLIFVDLLLWLADMIARVTATDVKHDTPVVANVIVFVQYSVMLAVLVRVVRARRGFDKSVDRAAALDTLVVCTGAALLCWKLFLGSLPHTPVLSAAALPRYGFPVLDMAILVLAVRASIGRGYHAFALKLLTAALFVLFSADTLYAWQDARGVYRPHNSLEALWCCCLALLGCAALHPSMTRLTERPRVKVNRLTGGQTIAMAGASSLAPVLLGINAARDADVAEFVIALGALVMFAGVFGRAHISARSDARANAALEQNQAELEQALFALQANERERRELLASVMRAGENERIWVAAELHDGPIQQLAALGFRLDRVRRRLARDDVDAARDGLEQTRDDVTAVVDDLRRLMGELRPPALEQRGIDGALRDYVASFANETGVDCSLNVELAGRVAGDVETALYRVTQEALQNVRKHAKARHLHIVIGEAGEELVLRIEDDGQGFASRSWGDEPVTSHYGLIGMRERVEQRGGVFRIDSTVGLGTALEARFPVERRSSTAVEEASTTTRQMEELV